MDRSNALERPATARGLSRAAAEMRLRTRQLAWIVPSTEASCPLRPSDDPHRRRAGGRVEVAGLAGAARVAQGEPGSAGRGAARDRRAGLPAEHRRARPARAPQPHGRGAAQRHAPPVVRRPAGRPDRRPGRAGPPAAAQQRAAGPAPRRHGAPHPGRPRRRRAGARRHPGRLGRRWPRSPRSSPPWPSAGATWTCRRVDTVANDDLAGRRAGHPAPPRAGPPPDRAHRRPRARLRERGRRRCAAAATRTRCASTACSRPHPGGDRRLHRRRRLPGHRAAAALRRAAHRDLRRRRPGVPGRAGRRRRARRGRAGRSSRSSATTTPSSPGCARSGSPAWTAAAPRWAGSRPGRWRPASTTRPQPAQVHLLTPALQVRGTTAPPR